MSLRLIIGTGIHPSHKFPVSRDASLLDEVFRAAHLTGTSNIKLGKYCLGTKHIPPVRAISRDENSILLILKPGGNGTCHEARVSFPTSFTHRKDFLLKKLRKSAKRISKNKLNSNKKN